MTSPQGFTNNMRLLVTGGRHFDEAALVLDVLSQLHRHYAIGALIHGAATGADRHAGHWAMVHSVQQIIFPANWKSHGLLAGPERNTRMLTEGKPDALVAFPGGKGTVDMVKKAKTYGLAIWKPFSPKSKPPFDGFTLGESHVSRYAS
jgi:hypothetical protein